MSKVVNATPETQLMPSPNQQKTSHCKVSLVALGAILIIGGAVAAGMLYFYSQLGSLSFCSLATIPFGIACIVAGIRCGSGDSTVTQENQHQTPIQPSALKDALKEHVKEPTPTQETAVVTQEWVDKTFPLKSNNNQEVKAKLQALDKKELSTFGHLLKIEHIAQLEPQQLNDLPWNALRTKNEQMVKQLLQDTLFSYTPTTEQTQVLNQLNESVINAIYDLLSPNQLSVLTGVQSTWLPCGEIVKSSITLAHYKTNLLTNISVIKANHLKNSPHWGILKSHVTISQARKPTSPPESKKQPEPSKPATPAATVEPKKEPEPKKDTVASVVKIEPTKQPESPPVGTKEWINLTYPLGSTHSQETKAKLQALGKDELSSYGALLGIARLEKLKPEQFNWLPWATLIKTNLRDMQYLLKNTFEGTGTSTMNLGAFLALEQPVIEHIWRLLPSNQLAALSGIQCTWLPWNTWDAGDIKYYLTIMYPEDKSTTKNKLLLLKDTKHWDAVTPYLGQKQLDLLK